MYNDNFQNEDQKPSDGPESNAHDRVNIYFDQLRGEIISLLESNSSSRETIQRLESELSAYKRAYAGLEAHHKQLEQLKEDADKQNKHLENQLKGNRIVALLDGDGAIFNSQLIAQGQSGGHTAAQKLSDSIVQHLVSNYGANRYQLCVYVFLNKRGLSDTFGRVGLLNAKVKFEEFIMGFNQAAERFIMLDVGSAKEAADAKIKALLEDEIRLPQTEKIIFGGCHDNGYATTLRSQLTAGFKEKLILLRGYSDMAAGINELELPSFIIPDLFISQKLAPSPLPTQSTSQSIPVPTATTTLPSQAAAEGTPLNSLSSFKQEFDALPFASIEGLEVATSTERPVPPSYSLAVQAPRKRPATPELDSSGSTASSDGSDESLPKLRPSLTSTASRRVNPNIPLSKHKPPPCTLFYLSNCKHGADCKYGHDYFLQAEHFQEIKVNAKKSPCPSRNKGEPCAWGDDCCYGHHCPNTTKCHYFKQNRCKFVGADMHKEPKAQST